MNKVVRMGRTSNDNFLESRFQPVGSAFCRQEHFPLKLYRMLEDVHTFGLTNVISWSEDGRSFIVHQPKVFEKSLMITYFKHTKYKSFQRQLNLYQFIRTARDKVLGVYSHPLFRRGQEVLCRDIKRPSKKLHVASFKTKGSRLQGTSLKTILSDIVPIEDNSSGEANPKPASRTLGSLHRSPSSNLETSAVHSITNEDLTAAERSSSNRPTNDCQRANQRFEHHGPRLLVSFPLPVVHFDEIHHDTPFETNSSIPSDALESDPLNLRSTEFNIRDISCRNISPFFLEADDDDCSVGNCSIGTIDSFSNIRNMIG